MHSLHKILVYVPNCADTNTPWDEKKEEIRSYAELVTEDYSERVFDWRETDCAGRWQEIYPDQVYLASDDIEWFVKELSESRQAQERDMNYRLEQLNEYDGFSIRELCDKVKEKSETHSTLDAYHLLQLSKLIYGEYDFDSGFYDSYNYTARVFKRTIEMVKNNPENWALVMFDYHI